MLPRLLRAMEHSNSAVINRASSAVAVTGNPAGNQYARKAAVDLGHVNGYCKNDVGVIMGVLSRADLIRLRTFSAARITATKTLEPVLVTRPRCWSASSLRWPVEGQAGPVRLAAEC
jgi:hypothetical protein